jgi:hypothetical protein
MVLDVTPTYRRSDAMTALLVSPWLELESTWDAITNWLDKVAATSHRNHRQLLKLEEHISMMETDLSEIERDMWPKDLTPSQHVSSFRLALRCRDIDAMMVRKWSSGAVQNSSLRALRGIHEEFLGPIPNERCEVVVFSISRALQNEDLCGYIEAHRLERDGHWCRREDAICSVTVTVVESPLWVHDIYRHLARDTVNGARLREHYAPGTGHSWARHGHFVGRPAPAPDDVTVRDAFTLWTPETEGSSYWDFADAIEALELL